MKEKNGRGSRKWAWGRGRGVRQADPRGSAGDRVLPSWGMRTFTSPWGSVIRQECDLGWELATAKLSIGSRMLSAHSTPNIWGNSPLWRENLDSASQCPSKHLSPLLGSQLPEGRAVVN